MARNNSFNELLAKYNTVIQQARDLTNQVRDKQAEISQVSGAYKHTEKLVRELCEKILAKDRSEMRLGKEYAWSKLGVDELIEKAKKFFDTYTLQTVTRYEQISDMNDSLHNKIHDLEDQLEKMLDDNSNYSSKEELEKAVEMEKKLAEKKAKMKAPEAEMLSASDYDIVDDDAPLSDTEKDVFEDVLNINQHVTPTPRSKGSVTPQRKESKDDFVAKTHEVSIKQMAADMDEIQKDVILLIGRDGISKVKEIEHHMTQKDIKVSTLRANIKSLVQAQLLTLESVSIPNAKISVYYLSPMGKRVFEYLFPDVTLIKSEAEEVIAEHDNLTHGYGIMYVSNLLKEKKGIKKTIDKNRKNAIKVGGGLYIPDIICELDNGKMYIEYEMGTHNTADFNSKLTKMMQVTKIINIVFPNKPILENVERKVVKWIERMGKDALKGVTVRLATARTIREMESPRQNKEWDVIYKPAVSGANPVVN